MTDIGQEKTEAAGQKREEAKKLALMEIVTRPAAKSKKRLLYLQPGLDALLVEAAKRKEMSVNALAVDILAGYLLAE